MASLVSRGVGGESFGELVARRRWELGLSQRDLADSLCAASGNPTVTHLPSLPIAHREEATRRFAALSIEGFRTIDAHQRLARPLRLCASLDRVGCRAESTH